MSNLVKIQKNANYLRMKMRKLMKHVNCTDVAAEFILISKVPKGNRVLVSWVNIVNPKNVYKIGVIEDIFITDEQMPNWKVYG